MGSHFFAPLFFPEGVLFFGKALIHVDLSRLFIFFYFEREVLGACVPRHSFGKIWVNTGFRGEDLQNFFCLFFPYIGEFEGKEDLVRALAPLSGIGVPFHTGIPHTSF